MTQMLSVMPDVPAYMDERASCGSPSVYKDVSPLYFCRETHDLSLFCATAGHFCLPAGCATGPQWTVLLRRGMVTC